MDTRRAPQVLCGDGHTTRGPSRSTRAADGGSTDGGRCPSSTRRRCVALSSSLVMIDRLDVGLGQLTIRRHVAVSSDPSSTAAGTRRSTLHGGAPERGSWRMQVATKPVPRVSKHLAGFAGNDMHGARPIVMPWGQTVRDERYEEMTW